MSLMLWVIVLLVTSCARTPVDTRSAPDVRIRLGSHGLPGNFFGPDSEQCRGQIIGYRFVSWLDDENLAVGFNLSPNCRVAPDRRVDGSARLLVFSSKGVLKAQRDIPYIADGYGELVAEGDAGAGPRGTLMFRFQSVNLDPEGRNESKSGVLLLDANLRDVVQIDQFLVQTTFVARSLVFNDGRGPSSYSMFKGVSQEASQHWRQSWPTGTMDRKFGEVGVAYALCQQELRPGEFESTDVVYAGARRKCRLVVEQPDVDTWMVELPPNSTASIVGILADGSVAGQLRSSDNKAGELVIWKKDRPREALPWIPTEFYGSVESGTPDLKRYLVFASRTSVGRRLFVFDRKLQGPLVESDFPTNARADLSPSGSSFATFEDGELRIYALPNAP